MEEKVLITAENLKNYIDDNDLKVFKANKKPVVNEFIRAKHDGSCMTATGASEYRAGDLLCITNRNDIYPISQEKFEELYGEAN